MQMFHILQELSSLICNPIMFTNYRLCVTRIHQYLMFIVKPNPGIIILLLVTSINKHIYTKVLRTGYNNYAHLSILYTYNET